MGSENSQLFMTERDKSMKGVHFSRDPYHMYHAEKDHECTCCSPRKKSNTILEWYYDLLYSNCLSTRAINMDKNVFNKLRWIPCLKNSIIIKAGKGRERQHSKYCNITDVLRWSKNTVSRFCWLVSLPKQRYFSFRQWILVFDCQILLFVFSIVCIPQL